MSDDGSGSPMMTIIKPTQKEINCFLFKQPGFQVNTEIKFKLGQYTWSISPYKYERDGQQGVDIIIMVQGIEPGTYLNTEFSLHQPGNQKQSFEHVFDANRSSFFYRRALTMPGRKEVNGMQPPSYYNHYRFLRNREDDEPDDPEENILWKSPIALDWDHDGEFPSAYDISDTFFKDINDLEDYKMTFLYQFIVESIQKTDFKPSRHTIVWPKASRTARYLNGKQLSVDGHWFARWPGFKRFMDNVDLLSPEDYRTFIDVMGVYYHSWNIDHSKLLYLVRAAEKFGFFDFPETQILVGNVDVYFSSMRSVLFAPLMHPLLKNSHPQSDQFISKFVHGENFSFSARCIYQDRGILPPVLKSFTTQNGMSWTVNLHRKTFSGKEFLSVSLILNGPYKEDENQLWRVEFMPAKHSSIGKLPKREHQRVLNTVQRTICFPTCWLWSDVVKEMGVNGPYNFQLKTQYNSLTGWRWDAVAGNVPATGVMNAQLQCGKHMHQINIDLIQEYCGKLREWVSVPGKPNRMEMDLDPNDVMHFLDHLYHASKLYTTDKWHRILKVAQAFDCEPVVDQFERALIRTAAQNVNDKQFDENYSCDYLRFNVEMRNQFRMQTLDEFLKNRKEPTVIFNSNSN